MSFGKVGTKQKAILARLLTQHFFPSNSKIVVWQILKEDFTLEDQPRSRRTSEIEGSGLITFRKENPRISSEEVATRLKVDNSTEFRHLKKL